MVHISEDKNNSLGGMFIVSVVYLGTFFALMLILPSAFLYAGKSYSTFGVPDYFSQEDIEHIAHFENGTLARPALGTNTLTLDFNPDVNFKFDIDWNYGIPVGANNVRFYHVTWEYWIFQQSDAMTIEDGSTYEIDLSSLTINWDSGLNASVFYPVRCDHITTKVWVSDTNGTRNDLTEAWNDGSLHIGLGFGIEDYETTISAWDVVGRLLTFNAPEIFGATVEGLALNLIVNTPTYASIGYLLYRLIIMAIPFLGG